MVQEVNIFLYLINLFNIFLIQRNQCIHGTVQVLAGKGCHTVQLLYYFKHGGSRIKHNLVPNIFQLIAFPVANLLVLAPDAQACQPDNQPREREQHNYLEYLYHGMGICHETSVVGGNCPNQPHNRLLCHKENDV